MTLSVPSWRECARRRLLDSEIGCGRLRLAEIMRQAGCGLIPSYAKLGIPVSHTTYIDGTQA